eukprot:2031791-Rhodomonas_salina.2
MNTNTTTIVVVVVIVVIPNTSSSSPTSSSASVEHHHHRHHHHAFHQHRRADSGQQRISPGRGPLVVWLTLNPKASGNSFWSFSISVPFPTPDGPAITSAFGPMTSASSSSYAVSGPQVRIARQIKRIQYIRPSLVRSSPCFRHCQHERLLLR